VEPDIFGGQEAQRDRLPRWLLPKCLLDHRGGQCNFASPTRQHWLEYDPVAFAVLLIGIGFVALIVLTI